MPHRTTLTLQDDVYEALRRESQGSGRRLRDVVNDAIRRGLEARDEPEEFVLDTFSSRMLMDITSTSRALEELEGPDHR